MNYNRSIAMKRFAYSATFTPDSVDGGFVITFRDLPEAITQGDSEQQGLVEAADCLEEAITARIDARLEIPEPTSLQAGEHNIVLPVQTALKATLYLSMKETAITKVQLAKLIEVDEKEVRRILDPRHGTKISTIERALAALGKKIELQIV